ncbi:unnamed protein product [Blepharisma stoltei]|uniref:Uncharacterized protein n=1 Tax=Blepharisma stoltei TaxID=1481888 RepID=A0AAU9JFE1_9CILI|nr:unnamed protein product [Blepharisma stoltei]
MRSPIKKVYREQLKCSSKSNLSLFPSLKQASGLISKPKYQVPHRSSTLTKIHLNLAPPETSLPLSRLPPTILPPKKPRKKPN